MVEGLENVSSQLNSESRSDGLRVKIVGVGGAGTNTVDRLQLGAIGRLTLAAINTDAQALSGSPIQEKLMIGRSVTRGLSTGGDPEQGRKAAEADAEFIQSVVAGMDLVFILAGLGGGTGSGAAPEVARIAHEQGALVISFVTLPFTLEGSRRHQVADNALAKLRTVCDAVIPLPNDLLLQQADENATVLDAFEKADCWIDAGVRSICSMLFQTGLINVDFATLKKAFCAQGGKTLFGLGRGEGEDYVEKALQDLAICPLLHTPEFARKADRLLVNIIGGTDLGIVDVNTIMSVVTERFGSKADTVLGAVIDDSIRSQVEICVIGTTDVGTHRIARSGSRSLVGVGTKAATAAPVAASISSARQAEKTPLPEIDDSEERRVHESKLRNKSQEKHVEQDEFFFTSEGEQRGYFDKTDRNMWEGEDLDIPTYLRRGVRIVL